MGGEGIEVTAWPIERRYVTCGLLCCGKISNGGSWGTDVGKFVALSERGSEKSNTMACVNRILRSFLTKNNGLILTFRINRVSLVVQVEPDTSIFNQTNNPHNFIHVLISIQI